MDSSFSIYHQSLCTCCDIVSRMANEMQSLLHDMEILLEQQITHQALQTQYNQLLLELKEKMDQISIDKLNCDEESNPLEEFEMFVKGIWKKVNKYLDQERRGATFYSAKRAEDRKSFYWVLRGVPYSLSKDEVLNELTDFPVVKVSRILNKDGYPIPLCTVIVENTPEGIPIAVIAEQLLDFCFHCSFTYKNIFLHPHCCEQFNVIYYQLSNVVFPEVQYSDDFEQSQIFVQRATPCLKFLLKIVDTFITDDNLNSVELICKGFIENKITKKDLNTNRIITLLNCCDILSTSFDKAIPRLKALYTHTDQMADYILNISSAGTRKSAPAVPTRLAGILNSSYMDCIHPANMSPKMYHVQINNGTKESIYKYETQRIVGATRRRRRYLDDSTSAIKVPKLQMQPFPY